MTTDEKTTTPRTYAPSRRRFLRDATFVSLGLIAASCAPGSSTGTQGGGKAKKGGVFHAAWPYDLPPKGHFNVFAAGALLVDGIYIDQPEAFAKALGNVQGLGFALLTTGENAGAFESQLRAVEQAADEGGVALGQYAEKSKSAVERDKRLGNFTDQWREQTGAFDTLSSFEEQFVNGHSKTSRLWGQLSCLYKVVELLWKTLATIPASKSVVQIDRASW